MSQSAPPHEIHFSLGATQVQNFRTSEQEPPLSLKAQGPFSALLLWHLPLATLGKQQLPNVGLLRL